MTTTTANKADDIMFWADAAMLDVYGMQSYATAKEGEAYAALRTAVERLVAERDELRKALQMLLTGCEHRTYPGVTGWHQKTMPSDAALDAARAALEGKP